MTALRVWAPRARRVDVVLAGERRPLQPEPGGTFTAGFELAPDTDYAFSLDGGPSRPDPRSAWQPAGVHGPSRWVDHLAFRWTDASFRPAPWHAAAVYELHIGTFSPEGTFDGAAAHLGHLVELGVTHVELMPVAAFPGQRGWGYDGVAPFAPLDAYGGPAGLKRLVDACHARGLAVLLDVVYNHLGPSGNYLAEFGPYFTTRHHTPWGWAVNLDDADSDEVRGYFIDNAVAWLTNYHVDGLRLDAVETMVDTGAVHFLEAVAAAVHEVARRADRAFVVVAESDLNDPRLVKPPAEGGYGLDAAWSDDFHHALHAALTGERFGYYADFGPVAVLAKVLEAGFALDGGYSRYRRRRHGRSGRGLAGTSFVVCAQNHDQVGNRALGERLGHLAGPDAAMVAGALLLTSPFVPLLFQGEEWAASSPFLYFTDHEEPDLAQAVREGRRREFAELGMEPGEVPDPQALETFERSKLDWSELAQEPHRRVLDWYRALLRLRRAEPDLQAGRVELARVRFDEPGRWLSVERGRYALACTLGEAPASFRWEGTRAPIELVLDSSQRAEIRAEALRLPGRAAAVVRLGGP
jgi:maltooligosyltrehalose trehalohydrolase